MWEGDNYVSQTGKQNTIFSNAPLSIINMEDSDFYPIIRKPERKVIKRIVKNFKNLSRYANSMVCKNWTLSLKGDLKNNLCLSLGLLHTIGFCSY